MNEALNSILTQHYRSPYIVLSILNRTLHSLCFWFHLLDAKGNYMVLQITGMQDDILVITFNLHRYTLEWTKAQRTDCILVAVGQKDIVDFKLQVVLVLRSPSSASRQKSYTHISSTNGVFLLCPRATMVFFPSTNFFAACKWKLGCY